MASPLQLQHANMVCYVSDFSSFHNIRKACAPHCWGTGLPYAFHIRRTSHNPPRGPSAGCWALTTANTDGTNGLTCRSTEELEILNFGHPSYGWPLRTLLSFGNSSSYPLHQALYIKHNFLHILCYCWQTNGTPSDNHRGPVDSYWDGGSSLAEPEIWLCGQETTT
jgi:hypothetical protein